MCSGIRKCFCQIILVKIVAIRQSCTPLTIVIQGKQDWSFWTNARIRNFGVQIVMGKTLHLQKLDIFEKMLSPKNLFKCSNV